MIAQIQTCFSHFFSKLVALALFLFILSSFNLQILTANAQAGSTPSVTKPTGLITKDMTPQQVSDKIGTLKNCSVNQSNGDSLKTDPNAANEFIFKCLKDIIQIVITISVILAVMRLIFVGIKFLNTFDDGAKLNAELVKAITGFIAGAVILGLFAAIINVVNPSALQINKIFSAQVIADYKCLNKGISDPNANTVDVKKCSNNNQGSGPSKSTTDFRISSTNNTEIERILKSDKPEDKIQKDVITSAIQTCNSSIIFNTKEQADDCTQYQNVTSQVGNSVDIVLPPNVSGDAFANGDYTDIKVEANIVTATYTIGKNSKPKKITFWTSGSCSDSPFQTTPPPTSIKSAQIINKQGCILKDIK